MSDTTNSPVLLYDGDCGFCSANVQFVLQHERLHTLRFASLQSPFGLSVLARHPELNGIDSMIWLEPPTAGQPELIFVRSTAAFQIISYLGGSWRLALLARIIPDRINDGIYDWVAGNRQRLSRLSQQCILPTPAQRSRFIDS